MLAIAGTIRIIPFFLKQIEFQQNLTVYVCTISYLFILQIFTVVRRIIKSQIQKFKVYVSLFPFTSHFHSTPLVHLWEASVSSWPQMDKTQSPPGYESTNYFYWKNCCVFCQGQICVLPDGNRSQNYETSTSCKEIVPCGKSGHNMYTSWLLIHTIIKFLIKL